MSLEYLPELRGGTVHEITERVSLRYTPGTNRYGYTSRYKLKMGQIINASVACNRSLDADKPVPDAFSASVEMRFPKLPVSLVAGDFNARFGQGLALWTGSNFTSLNSPTVFMKRSFGVTPSSSFTGNNVLTGLAAEYTAGRFVFTAFTAAPGVKSVKAKPEKLRILPAFNATYGWRNGQAGVTHHLEFAGMGTETYIPIMNTSFDFAMCHKGMDFFSEFVYDWVRNRPVAVAGIVAPVGDTRSVAALLRALDSEYSVAVSGSLKRKRLDGSASGEMTLYTIPKVDTQSRSMQLKFHTQWQYILSELWQLNLRLTERVRSWGQFFRTDLRTDWVWKSGIYALTYRFNILYCDNLAWLTYIEGGVKPGKLSLYLRYGIFVVDDWDDRIYAYERDVPGAYNSPAFYGRGMWTSMMTSYKPTDWCKLYLRAGLTIYPFMHEKKPGKAELRFQSVFDF